MVNSKFYEKIKTASREEVMTQIKEYKKELTELEDLILKEKETTPEIRERYKILKTIMRKEAEKYSLREYEISGLDHRTNYMSWVKESFANGFKSATNDKNIDRDSVGEVLFQLDAYFGSKPELKF